MSKSFEQIKRESACVFFAYDEAHYDLYYDIENDVPIIIGVYHLDEEEFYDADDMDRDMYSAAEYYINYFKREEEFNQHADEDYEDDY